MPDEATTDAPDTAVPPAPPRVDVTKLVNEAASKSGLLWVRLPEGTTHPVWHVWHDDGDERGTGPAAYVVSGPGEQHLPWLPDEVELVLRSKDTGGRLLTMHATARALEPGTDAWEQAAAVLRPERLNAPGSAEEVLERWRDHNTLHVLTPHGRPGEQPGHYDDGSGAAPVRPAAPATARRRPWHWRGRAGARRNTTPENTTHEPSSTPPDGG
ncbi:hypothetical protein [Arthrobacter sp. NEB 688]|uniref:hypothetical protein n=1 Tax=Arthrobacter sp. NEB 688 TaxID=904039 RepID=UPI001C206F12|nr:hypothetical protein [Arthrobacter sp. NEB 688]